MPLRYMGAMPAAEVMPSQFARSSNVDGAISAWSSLDEALKYNDMLRPVPANQKAK